MENVYLEIKSPNIKGESVSGQGKDKIELLSWSQSVHMPITHGHASGVSVKHGRSDFSDMTVSKYLDATTPLLLQATAGGTNFKTAHITVFMNDKDAGTPVEYYQVEMEDIIITSHSIGHAGHDRAVETLTLHFNKIKWTYTPQKRDSPGGGAGKVAGSWDLESNKK